MLFRNYSPFPPLYFESRDEKQQDFGVVALRGTFQIEDRQRLRMTEVQDPIVFSDEYFGDPQETSLKTQACLIPFKPSTDVFVTANAYSPTHRPETSWSVDMKFGAIGKQLTVTGPRTWERRLGGFSLTKPQPVSEVPIMYEAAYGGRYYDEDGELKVCPENPVGRGFLPRGNSESSAAPQVFATEAEARNLSYGRATPAVGFGPIAPNWAPRCNRVGTYNEMWKRTRFPDLPGDFDFAFYNAASTGLTLDGFAKGDEVVELTNMTKGRRVVFALPAFQLASLMRFDSGAVIPGPVMLDTVHINAITMCVHLVWRTIYPVNAGLRAFEIRAKDSQARFAKGA